MRNWVRPYQRDGENLATVATIVASVLGLAPLCGLVASGAAWSTVTFGVCFVVLWEVVLWRVMLVGVYVSDYGIKIRRVHRTDIVAWSRVTRVWAGPATTYDAWQIWISAHDPEQVFETPIWRKGSRARHRNRIALPPDQFAATLDALNR